MGGGGGGDTEGYEFKICAVILLIKRLEILGLPNDVVKLIEIWLTERYFYVSVNGCDSTVRVTWYGIVQGSILGPILYAIFISPLFDIENLTCFADDILSFINGGIISE